MRYLLDTNILIYYISDKSSLSQNVLSVLEDYDSVLCISTETLRELIVAYRDYLSCINRKDAFDFK